MRSHSENSKRRTPRGRSPISIGDLLEAKLLKPDQRLTFRGRAVVATVAADGRITFGGNLYGTPSAAASAAADGMSYNGWLAWSTQSEGGVFTLAELRDQLLAKRAVGR
jgi:hypothetical protein